MKQFIVVLILLEGVLLFSCSEKKQTIKVTTKDITESVYASGNLESENQYQVFSIASGIISTILVKEGELVKKNTPLFQISNNQSKIQVESALLSNENASLKNNSNKLEELKLNLKAAKLKWRNDSLLFIRKNVLFKKNVITIQDFENAELNYQNSLSNFNSSLLQYQDLLRQLKYNEKLSKKNTEQILNTNKDFTIKSEIEGEIFTILKKKGEFISPQTPIAIIGSNKKYLLKLQVDEYDIVKIKKGQKAKISLDSYKGKTFDAIITKIYPIMNERSKTFLVDAQFINTPPTLYPNLSVEANIIISEMKNTLTIPRAYLSKNNTVFFKNGEEKKVKIGLKNYEFIQIIEGLNKNDEITLPNEN